MKHYYEPGTTRWFRWPSSHGDPRGHSPPKGWTAEADQLDYHPITQRPLRNAPQWWVCETYVGETNNP